MVRLVQGKEKIGGSDLGRSFTHFSKLFFLFFSANSWRCTAGGVTPLDTPLCKQTGKRGGGLALKAGFKIHFHRGEKVELRARG